MVTDSTAWGGAERYLEQLCTSMVGGTLAPRIALFSHPSAPAIARRFQSSGIPTDLLPVARTSSSIRQFGAWRGYFARHRPALVHVNRTDTFGFVAALLAARSAGVEATVMMEHLPVGFGPPPAGQRFRPLRRFGVRRNLRVMHRRISGTLPSVVVTGSQASKAVLCRDFAYREARVVVVPNGVTVGPPAAPATRDALRAALHVDAGTVLVGSVGRLTHQKGIDWLLRVFRAVLARCPSARLCLVGDGEGRAGFEALRSALSLDDAVMFVGHHDDVSPWYAALDVFVMASRYESAPFALLEAMSAGLAVIGSDIGPIREVLEPDSEGACGLLVPCLDEGSLAAAIVTLIEQPARRRELGERARARVAARFTVERCVTETLDLYEGLLRARPVLE